jgi:hypothetical protein
MNKVEKIGREIEELTPSELLAFRKWFYEFDAKDWDREIQDDLEIEKLDA